MKLGIGAKWCFIYNSYSANACLQGAPVDFRLRELQPAAVAALGAAGISLGGCGSHLSPLGLAVQQHSTATAQVLLRSGADVQAQSSDGRPLLLTFLDAARASLAGLSHSGGTSGSSSGAAGWVPVSGAGLLALEDSLHLLLLLLQAGADPLQQGVAAAGQPASFLTGASSPFWSAGLLGMCMHSRAS